MIGTTISHYKILQKIGEGGMGIVYKAHDTKLDRNVALKFLPLELTKERDARERFIHEAKAASALDHTNICTIYEVDETDNDQLYIAMACYDGETLKDKIERSPLKVDDAINITTQIALGLSKAHEKNIVHRDIKPANILITTDDTVKILDFGLAKLRGLTKLTKTGSTVGTAPYMSPEQAKGETVDHRTDIWSLGVVLYEMLTGQLPFKGDYEQAIAYQITNVTPEPVTGLRSGIPLELERVVNKCLEKNPDERYQTASDLIADLKHLQRMTSQPVQQTTEKKAKPSTKKKRWAVIAALLVIVIGLVIIFKPFSREPEKNRKSIAVLPFKNMSDSKEDEYFSDGITEDIITQLTYIAELKVISRTSIMQYKNTSKNLRDIARELDVATVLEGSVRRASNQVRIVAQLIDAANDEHVWAQTYDKEMTQIFAIQSDVAQQIASALKAKLSPFEKGQIAKKRTENTEAYNYYLKGREYYNDRTKKGYESAIELFKKALELDSSYALAYAGLGDAYVWRLGYGFPIEWLDSSIAMSEKAISIDLNLAEGYKALGFAYSSKGKLRKGLELYRKAIDLNPNYYPAVLNTGFNNGKLGQLDECLKWDKKALALEPTRTILYSSLGVDYLMLCNDSMAQKYFHKAISLQPERYDYYQDIGNLYLLHGEFKKAFDLAQKVLSVQPENFSALFLAASSQLFQSNYAEAEKYYKKCNAMFSTAATTELGYIFLKTNRKKEAQRMLARSRSDIESGLQQDNELPEYPLELAKVNSIEGNKEEAYKWLQKAIDTGWRDYRYAQIDPLLENLRDDDRFKQMMAYVKAQVEEMRKRVDEMEKAENQ